MSRIRWSLLLVGLLSAALGSSLEARASEWPAGPGAARASAVIPACGTQVTLEVASWNLEWFGSTSKGPEDEPLQLANAREVILGTDLDIWALEEVVSNSQFDNLEAQLSGYEGFVANEPGVEDGSRFYGPNEQKVGILYKTSVATVQAARLILTSHERAFAGRPPLEVQMRATVNGVTRDLVVIVLHMKAFNDPASWQRRRDASQALKDYLDSTWPDAQVLVVGDWNDDVDVSITPGRPSPYQNFVSDPARYAFPTLALSAAQVTTTVSHSEAIDHHLVTDELEAHYMQCSAQAYRVDSYLPDYAHTTSDHYPVITAYLW